MDFAEQDDFNTEGRAVSNWQLAKNVFAVLHWKIPALLGPRPVARLTEAKSP